MLRPLTQQGFLRTGDLLDPLWPEVALGVHVDALPLAAARLEGKLHISSVVNSVSIQTQAAHVTSQASVQDISNL